MGTSTARKAPPKGAYWRKAKTAAAHYAANGEAARLSVAEVVARYAVAVAPVGWDSQPDQNLLEATARTAAALNRFYETWEAQGWQRALAQLGIAAHAGHNWEALMPAVLDALAGPGAHLAEAVARTALLDHFAAMGLLDDVTGPVTSNVDAPPLPPGDGAWHFLALALFHRYIADMGETLEFHAPSVAAGRERQEAIRAHFLAQLNLLLSLTGEEDGWQSQPLTWVENFLGLLANYHGR